MCSSPDRGQGRCYAHSTGGAIHPGPLFRVHSARVSPTVGFSALIGPCGTPAGRPDTVVRVRRWAYSGSWSPSQVDGMFAPVPWLYLDADGFFASCEEAADPALHGRPVDVVASDPYADAPLIAVNTVAQAAGVRSGNRLSDERELCAGYLPPPTGWFPERYARLVERHAEARARARAPLLVRHRQSVCTAMSALVEADEPPSLHRTVRRAGFSDKLRSGPGVCANWLDALAASGGAPHGRRRQEARGEGGQDGPGAQAR